MIHPNALHRRIEAIRHASGWNGGRLAPDAPAAHRIALDARGAGAMLDGARYELAWLADRYSGSGVASLAWRYSANRTSKEQAHRLIRNAGAMLMRAEQRMRELETARAHAARRVLMAAE